MKIMKRPWESGSASARAQQGTDNQPMSAQPSPSPVPPRRLRSGGWTAGWSLKLQINLLVTGLMALFVAVLLWLQIDGTRSGVREEIVAANRVAT